LSKVLVHLTLFEDPVEVGEDELVNLRQQGLLVDIVAAAPAKPVVPAPSATAATFPATAVKENT